jgi:hypothetical protein
MTEVSRTYIKGPSQILPQTPANSWAFIKSPLLESRVYQVYIALPQIRIQTVVVVTGFGVTGLYLARPFFGSCGILFTLDQAAIKKLSVNNFSAYAEVHRQIRRSLAVCFYPFKHSIQDIVRNENLGSQVIADNLDGSLSATQMREYFIIHTINAAGVE